VEFQNHLKENDVMNNFEAISKNASIGNNVSIHPLALVEDDTVIGDNTQIGPFCIVRKGTKIGKNCKFTAYCEIRENVIIGDNTSFGSRCTISANAVIGSNVVIKYSFVLTDTPNLETGQIKSVGEIGDGVLIGANVTLMPGFSIGKNSVIGACSQVRSNVGNDEIWYGNPAKIFKNKF
jgi:acetyltransferase-like isoleucine patch superfamily enzyme